MSRGKNKRKAAMKRKRDRRWGLARYVEAYRFEVDTDSTRELVKQFSKLKHFFKVSS